MAKFLPRLNRTRTKKKQFKRRHMKLELGQLGRRRVKKSSVYRYKTDATILTHFELEVWNRLWKPFVKLVK